MTRFQMRKLVKNLLGGEVYLHTKPIKSWKNQRGSRNAPLLVKLENGQEFFVVIATVPRGLK